MRRYRAERGGYLRAVAGLALLIFVALVVGSCASQATDPVLPSPTATSAIPETSTEVPPTLAPSPEPALEGQDPELVQAGELAARSKIEDAIALYQASAIASPQNALPEIGWAWALIYDDELELALTHAQRAVDLDPGSSDAWAVLSRAHAGNGDAEGAMASALEAMAKGIDSAQARAALGEAHLLKGETLQALRAAERALDLGKTNPDAHRLRARVFLALENQPERAAAQLQTAAAYQPQLWLRRHELGQMLLEAGYPEVAELAFEDALALRPKAVTYAGLGEAKFEQQEHELAREALATAIDLGLEDAKAYGYLAGAAARLGQCDAAEAYAQQALALDPAQLQALESKDVCQGTAKATATSQPAATETPSAAEPTSTRAVVALGGRIAFPIWNADLRVYEIYIVKAKDGTERMLAVGGMHQPALSPDGQWLAANGERENHELLSLLKLDGSRLVEISAYVEDGQPAWSPDGEKLIYASFRQGIDRQPRMYALDGIPWEGGTVEGREIRTGQDAVRGEMPSWAPDGRIVYRGCGLDSPQFGCNGLGLHIASGAPEAVSPVRLTDHAGDSRPAVHDTQVVFMSDRDGDWEIYAVGLDGTGLTQLTDNSVNDGLPIWSPDGKTVALVSDQGGTWAVWAMAPDGTNLRKLFDLGGNLGPDWTREQISWAP